MRQGGESERGWEVVKAPSVVEHGLELPKYLCRLWMRDWERD